MAAQTLAQKILAQQGLRPCDPGVGLAPLGRPTIGKQVNP